MAIMLDVVYRISLLLPAWLYASPLAEGSAAELLTKMLERKRLVKAEVVTVEEGILDVEDVAATL